jgi:hypothetical protein
MADSYSNVAGGKLKLKGGVDVGGKIKKYVHRTSDLCGISRLVVVAHERRLRCALY